MRVSFHSFFPNGTERKRELYNSWKTLPLFSDLFGKPSVLGTSIGDQLSLDFRKLRRDLKHHTEEKQPLGGNYTVERQPQPAKQLSRELEKLIKQARLEEVIKGRLFLAKRVVQAHVTESNSLTQFTKSRNSKRLDSTRPDPTRLDYC